MLKLHFVDNIFFETLLLLRTEGTRFRTPIIGSLFFACLGNRPQIFKVSIICMKENRLIFMKEISCS